MMSILQFQNPRLKILTYTVDYSSLKFPLQQNNWLKINIFIFIFLITICKNAKQIVNPIN